MPFDKMLSWLPWGFVVFGILFLIVAIRTIVGSSRRRESWHSYPGRVVGSKLDDGQFQAQVAYTVDGREITFWNRFTSTSVRDRVPRLRRAGSRLR